MNFVDFKAGADDSGRRLDRVLRRFIPEAPLSQIYQSIRKGLIKINGIRAKQNDRITEGDTISIAAFLAVSAASEAAARPDCTAGSAEDFPYEIIFSSRYLLAVNKPYDVTVQGKNSMADAVLSYWKTHHTESSLSFSPGPLHRLDRKTTGLLVFSQNLSGAQWFSEAVSSHYISKKYITVLQGKLITQEEWKDSIERDTPAEETAGFHTMKRSDSENGVTAVTTAVPLAYGIYKGQPVTLAEMVIATGRMHQIRLQSSLHGYPLLGDTAYGGIKIHEERDFYLHAYELCIPENNPVELPPVLKASILTDFKKMLDKSLIKWDGKLII